MDFKTTRRALSAVLFAGASVPFADIMFPPRRANAAPVIADVVPAPAPVPEIPGLAAIEAVKMICHVSRGDDTYTTVVIEVDPSKDATELVHHTGGTGPESLTMHVTVPVNALASLPNWLQREFGYAALAARNGDLR